MSASVTLKNINFSYGNSNNVLSIPDLSISKGEKVFIHGPSGSGKSTLLNLIAGVLQPKSGELQILGTDFNKLSIGQKDQFRGDHIGFVFQSFNLIPYLSIYENILLPIITSKKRNQKTSKNTELEIQRIAGHLNIDSLLDKVVTELSVGQQQRVAVARALIGDPELIIADEPTSSLDEEVTERFMKLILEEHKIKNFTLIFVSHDKRLARFFDREIALSEINKGVGNNA